ncbi:MAG: hypothetical protein DWQ05_08525 [Calditrichaeota bacterium]|nr:MAG: hypothetical protein DWQ05_08525 [Calditrichota bacterium]
MSNAKPKTGSRPFPPRSENGVSLIELIVTITVTAIISIIIGQMLSSGARAYSFVIERKAGMQTSRLALLRVKKELRQIASKDSLIAATTDSIRFYKQGGGLISIAKTSSNLNLNGQLLADNVSLFRLSYFNDQRTLLTMPIANLYDIHQIKFELRTTVNGNSIYLFNEIKPRNF